MEYGVLLLVLAGGCAFFMAFNNGANDVANSFASAVGAKAISIKQAVLIAGFMNLLGALLLGGVVSTKLVTGVVEPESFGSAGSYLTAMFSALLGAGFFVLLSTLKSMPVSSSHSVVGSIVGVTVVAAGTSAVNWQLVALIVVSWFTSPVIAGFLGWFFYFLVRRLILRGGIEGMLRRLETYLPYGVGFASFVFILVLTKGGVMKSFRPDRVEDFLILGLVVIPYTTLAFQALLRQWIAKLEDKLEDIEGVFRKLQVGTSSYVAFAHGANDVANAISPVFGIFLVVTAAGGALPTDELVAETGIPFWILVLGGIGIAAGVGLLGHKVIATLSEKITEINNSKGFCIDTATATTVVGATLMGLPVSSTHAATGAITGSGIHHGNKFQIKTLTSIFAAWIFTVPIAATLSAGIYLFLSWIILN